MKLLIAHFSPVSSNFSPSKPQYISHHTVLQIPQLKGAQVFLASTSHLKSPGASSILRTRKFRCHRIKLLPGRLGAPDFCTPVRPYVPSCERPRFRPIHKTGKVTVVCVYLVIFRQQKGRYKIPNQTAAGFPCI